MKYNLSEIMKEAWKIVKTMGKTISEALKAAWAAAKSGRRFLTVKEWIIDKAQDTASYYNLHIDFVRDENGYRKVENGYITVIVEEQLAESEKAIKVRLHTGDVVGSGKGWSLWIPKSQIA